VKSCNHRNRERHFNWQPGEQSEISRKYLTQITTHRATQNKVQSTKETVRFNWPTGQHGTKQKSEVRRQKANQIKPNGRHNTMRSACCAAGHGSQSTGLGHIHTQQTHTRTIIYREETEQQTNKEHTPCNELVIVSDRYICVIHSLTHTHTHIHTTLLCIGIQIYAHATVAVVVVSVSAASDVVVKRTY